MNSIEFGPLELDRGFVPVPGRSKISTKVISDSLDHEAKTGRRTRVIRIDPGFSSAPHDHLYWEELLIFHGSLQEGEPGDGEVRHTAPAFARRAPGHLHGPIRAEETCYLLEVNWYDANQRIE